MEKKIINQIVGAVLSGQKRVIIGGIEVSWKPLKENLTRTQRETEAQRIATMNLPVLIG